MKRGGNNGIYLLLNRVAEKYFWSQKRKKIPVNLKIAEEKLYEECPADLKY